MPTIVKSVGGFKAKGVDVIAVTAVNDAFVLAEWKKTTGAVEVELLADGNADFAKAIDLVLGLTGSGMGLRSRRYSMLVDDGVVKSINADEPGKFEVSSGDALLAQI
jgi:peroxiredoxin